MTFPQVAKLHNSCNGKDISDYGGHDQYAKSASADELKSFQQQRGSGIIGGITQGRSQSGIHIWPICQLSNVCGVYDLLSRWYVFAKQRNAMAFSVSLGHLDSFIDTLDCPLHTFSNTGWQVMEH